MIEKNKTEQVLDNISAYLGLVRYQYSMEEKLERLSFLSEYYKKKITEEKLPSNMELCEQLSDKLILPLKVRGVFLTEGRPRRRFYTGDELKKSVSNPLNSRFPICLDHKDNEAGQIIGLVDKIWYDESIRGLRWKGHLNSELFARNVIDGAITQVSATIFSAKEDYDPELGIVGQDLVFKELSLVLKGAEPQNSIIVDN